MFLAERRSLNRGEKRKKKKEKNLRLGKKYIKMAFKCIKKEAETDILVCLPLKTRIFPQ